MKTLSGLFAGLIISSTAFADMAGVHVIDTAKAIVVSPGQTTLAIQLNANPTTGYQWYIGAFQSPDLSLKGYRYIAPDTHLIGAPGLAEFTFAVSPNFTQTPHMAVIPFYYARNWDVSGKTKTVVTVVSNPGASTNVPSTQPASTYVPPTQANPYGNNAPADLENSNEDSPVAPAPAPMPKAASSKPMLTHPALQPSMPTAPALDTSAPAPMPNSDESALNTNPSDNALPAPSNSDAMPAPTADELSAALPTEPGPVVPPANDSGTPSANSMDAAPAPDTNDLSNPIDNRSAAMNAKPVPTAEPMPVPAPAPAQPTQGTPIAAAMNPSTATPTANTSSPTNTAAPAKADSNSDTSWLSLPQ